MKFCMVTTFYPPFNFGGDGIYVEALSRALVERGHEVSVVHCVDSFRLKSAADDLDGPPEEMRHGVRVHRLRSRLGWLSPLITQQTGRPGLKSARLREILGRDFDVVNYHNISLVGGPAVLSIPAGRALKVWTVHEHWLLCSTHIFWKNDEARCDKRECLSCCIKSKVPPQAWRLTGLVDRSLGHVDVMIAPSRFTAELYRPVVSPKPVHVLPLFVRLKPPVRDEHADATVRSYFLYVGRITSSKGVKPLLAQFAGHPGLRIKVAGDGDLLSALREEYKEAANIELLGPVGADQLGTLYAGAIAVVLPSLAPETFGLTVVEGMAFGTPAVVHDAGGCREIVEASEAGFVFTHFEELPAILVRLQKDAGLWRWLSEQARRAFAANYTVERHVTNYLQLLEVARAERIARLDD